jgi:hypothetical protein
MAMITLRPLGRFSAGVVTRRVTCRVARYVRRGALPVGVQVVAAPFREDNALRVAVALEASGFFDVANNRSLKPLMCGHWHIWLVQNINSR